MISLLKDAASYAVWEDGVLIYADEWVIQEPKPDIPAEVWNQTPLDPQKAWAATVALSRGTGA